MMTGIHISLLAVLSIIAFQDLQRREIHVIAIGIVWALSLAKGLMLNTFSEVALWTACIIGFLFVQLILVQLYFKIRRGTWIRIDHQFGFGDVLLLLAVIPLFNIRNYVLFYLLSLLLALIIHGTYLHIVKPREFTIPLATYISLVLVIFLAVEIYGEINLYQPIL